MQTGLMTSLRRLGRSPTLHLLGLLLADLIIGLNLFNSHEGERFLATFGSIAVLLYLMEHRSLYHRLAPLLFSLGVYGLTLIVTIAGGVAGFYALGQVIAGHHIPQIADDPAYAWPFWLTAGLTFLALMYDRRHDRQVTRPETL
jgi:membrane-bound ClpP family serine protease